MPDEGETPARQTVLEDLQRAALQTYGEDRCAEASLQAALSAAATAVWRVSQEPIEPLGPEPLATDG